MENKEKMAVGLPENAFRELREGEKYEPIMKPNQVYPEVNGWSVSGQYMGKDTKRLQRGVYIVNGKKVVKK